ncbi:MAG: serine hydrolase domain-containing protein [Janthinobacterium lividum]
MNRRRFLQVAGGAASLLGPASRAVAEATPPTVQRDAIEPTLRSRLDREITSYMQANNAPGMQFAVVDLYGTEYIASYGYENLQTHQALTPQRLFQIGSISKSMAAIAALQLVAEGKLDLHRPVLEYLPWLPWKMEHGAVTLHHILTHTTGMPGGGALFFPANRWIHRQRYAPGTRYFYSNMAFNVVGRLVEFCDRRTYQESLAARVFHPVGMTSSRSSLGGAEWALQSVSYIPAVADAPFHRFDPLREAAAFHEDTSAGCVASTAADMARYLRCLLRGGVTETGTRILSEKGFAAMTSRHVDADEWGPHAGYGYGIGTDTSDSNHILMHTGGMVSFMSAIYLDMSHGVAAFASINAQQGYRPMPVVRFATEAVVADQAKLPLPSAIRMPAFESDHQPTTSSLAPRHPQLLGSYVNDDPWDGLIQITEVDGKLRADGAVMEAVGDGSFHLLSEPTAPDRASFDCFIAGKAQVLLLNGTEYRRWNKASVA